MPSCQLCSQSGFRLQTKNCKKCGRLMCSAHWYAVPMVSQTQLTDALQGRSTMFARGSASQDAMSWMANPASAPERWHEARYFCGPQCAAGFVGTLTPHDIQGADGQPLRVLTYSEFGSTATTRSGEVDYTRMASAGGIFVVVGSNLPPELQPVFKARATQSDLQAQETAKARAAWTAGNYALAAEIYDRLGQPQFAAQAREQARTVIQKNITVNYNQLMEQLKEIRKPVAYNCPSCGGPNKMDSTLRLDQAVKCQFCGGSFSIPNIMETVNRMVSGIPSPDSPATPART